MAEDEGLVPYKDIFELKKELEGMRGKKEISTEEIYNAMQKLSQTITDMLEVFGAAAEQIKLEEKEYEADSRRHDMVISKIDKIIDQNKTIAEGMISIVELVKEKLVAVAKEREEPLLKPRPFAKPEWQPKPEPMMPKFQQPMQQMPQPMPIAPMPAPEFGIHMPPMQPTPLPDLDFPEEPFPLEEEPKKKGLFGMFKK